VNEPRLKVLHVISGLRRGGAEAVLARLVAASAADFEHVVVSLRDEGHFGPILRGQGVPVHAIELERMRDLPARLRNLVRIMRSVQPDVVQTWLYHGDVFGGLAARWARVPAVLWGIRNTNLDVASIGRSLRWIARLGARLSRFVPDAIVCNSEHAARVHVNFGYHESSFRIVFNGYDTAKFKPDVELRDAARHEFRVAADETLIGKMARWDPQKDHGNLLTALAQLRGRHSEVRALLAGEGMVAENEPLMAMIRRAGLQNRIILAGARDDVPTLMNALDLHVMASLGEAFPNAVAEAMACGTPCVVTDVGDAARIVGDTGWVVPARNSSALAAAIEQGLQALERDGRQALASRCRRRIEEHYPLLGMVAAYGALWREFGGSGRSG
jgi:glycosyltransferase involved in cell wall biosynthesis